jgi:hypothetical protein
MKKFTFRERTSEIQSAVFVFTAFGLGEAAANRISSAVDVAGGWQGFIDRIKNQLGDKH